MTFAVKGVQNVVHVVYPCVLVAESKNGVGFSKTGTNLDVCLWLPKKEIEKLHYENPRRDANTIYIDEKIVGFDIPHWLARARGLIVEQT